MQCLGDQLCLSDLCSSDLELAQIWQTSPPSAMEYLDRLKKPGYKVTGGFAAVAAQMLIRRRIFVLPLAIGDGDQVLLCDNAYGNSLYDPNTVIMGKWQDCFYALFVCRDISSRRSRDCLVLEGESKKKYEVGFVAGDGNSFFRCLAMLVKHHCLNKAFFGIVQEDPQAHQLIVNGAKLVPQQTILKFRDRKQFLVFEYLKVDGVNFELCLIHFSGQRRTLSQLDIVPIEKCLLQIVEIGSVQEALSQKVCDELWSQFELKFPSKWFPSRRQNTVEELGTSPEIKNKVQLLFYTGNWISKDGYIDIFCMC